MVYRQGYFICYYRYMIELVTPLILLTLVAHSYFAITEGKMASNKKMCDRRLRLTDMGKKIFIYYTYSTKNENC